MGVGFSAKATTGSTKKDTTKTLSGQTSNWNLERAYEKQAEAKQAQAAGYSTAKDYQKALMDKYSTNTSGGGGSGGGSDDNTTVTDTSATERNTAFDKILANISSAYAGLLNSNSEWLKNANRGIDSSTNKAMKSLRTWYKNRGYVNPAGLTNEAAILANQANSKAEAAATANENANSINKSKLEDENDIYLKKLSYL